MAFTIPYAALQQAAGPDLIDVINNLANQRANLAKLQALTQGQNLANQESQLKMPYVAPQAAATLGKTQAETRKTGVEADYIPTKYSQAAQRLGIEAGNLAVNRQRFSQDQLDALKKWRLASANTADARALSPMGKGVLEQNRVLQGLDVTGQPLAVAPQSQMQAQAPQFPGQSANIVPQDVSQDFGGQGALAPAQAKTQTQAAPAVQAPVLSEAQQRLSNQYELKRIKDSTDASLRKAFPQINSIDTLMAKIPFESISQFFGPAGQAKAAAEYYKSIKGLPVSPEYKAYQNFLTTDAPSLASQMRQFLNDTVTPYGQKKYANIIVPSTWTSNPQLAMNQFNALKDVYDIEKQARVDAANNPSVFYGKTGKGSKAQENHRQAIVNENAGIPTFNTKQEFDIWKAGASPEQIAAYKAHLGYR